MIELQRRVQCMSRLVRTPFIHPESSLQNVPKVSGHLCEMAETCRDGTPTHTIDRISSIKIMFFFINAQYEIIQKNSLFPELMFVQSFLEQLTSLGVQNKTVQLAETRKTPRGLGMFEMFEMFGCVPLHVM